MEDKVLETVVNGIKWNMLKDVLVKPLPAITVTKEFTEQIPNGKVDKDGFNEYDTKTETREVKSDWATGIVLQIPSNMTDAQYKVGDTIAYNKKFAMYFDLIKDTQLVKPYDIVAVK